MNPPSSLTKTQQFLSANNIECLILNDLTNIRWVSNFTGTYAVMLITPTDSIFITDGRYINQSQEEVLDSKIEIITSSHGEIDVIIQWIEKNNILQIQFETSLSYQKYHIYKQSFPNIQFNPSSNPIHELRKIKTAEEINKIEFACQISDQCLHHIRSFIKPGVTEYDLSLEIEFYIRRAGGRPGFDTIVAAGPNSAKPHARPSHRKLEQEEFLVIDFGVYFNGYNSDMTRTFYIGTPNQKQCHMYVSVLEAQEKSIESLKIGNTAAQVDSVARKILQEKNYDEYFCHSLGHGLGIDVHDPGSLSQLSKDIISENQVWTIEPGIYINTLGGIRIEDDVVVSKKGPIILNQSPKSLKDSIIS